MAAAWDGARAEPFRSLACGQDASQGRSRVSGRNATGPPRGGSIEGAAAEHGLAIVRRINDIASPGGKAGSAAQARRSGAKRPRGPDTGLSWLAGLDGEGVLQVRRTHGGRVAEAIGTWRPAREDARSAVTLERLVAQARPVPFEGLLDDPAARGSKRYTGHVQVLRISRYEWNESLHGGSDVRTLVRFAPVDPAFATEPSYRARGPASSPAGAPGAEGSVRATLPPLAAPLPDTLAPGVARLEGIAGRLWDLDDGTAASWMSTPAESGMAWNALVAAVTRLPHTALHVIVGDLEGASP